MYALRSKTRHEINAARSAKIALIPGVKNGIKKTNNTISEKPWRVKQDDARGTKHASQNTY